MNKELLRVESLKKYFPVTKGLILQKTVGHVQAVDGIDFTIRLHGPTSVHIKCTVKTTHKTGVEMEALTGASVAALAIYDMCKSLSSGIVIRETRLLEKTGGKADFRHEG